MGFAQAQADDVKVVVAAEIADGRWVQVAEIQLHSSAVACTDYVGSSRAQMVAYQEVTQQMGGKIVEVGVEAFPSKVAPST